MLSKVRYYCSLFSSKGWACNGYECEYNKTAKSFVCSACRQGYRSYFQNSIAHTSKCVQCPAGSYYQDQPASDRCKICQPGQFVPPERSPGPDASDCQTCQKGTITTNVAGTIACSCLPGYSRRYRFGSCHKCIEEGYNCSLDYPTIKQGFWITWQGTRVDFSSHHT